MQTRCDPCGGEAGIEKDRGHSMVDLNEGDSPIPESDLQIQVERTAQGHFVKGQSGNPAGKPQGCRNHATRSAERLLDGEAEALTRKAVTLALGGDALALRLCLDRVIAPRRDRPVHFALPPIAEIEMSPRRWRRSRRRWPKVPSPPARGSRWRRWSTPISGRSRQAISTGG